MVTAFIVNTSVTLYIYLLCPVRRECVNIKSGASFPPNLGAARTPHVQKSAFYFPLSATKDFLCGDAAKARVTRSLAGSARCFIPTRKYLEKILLRNELCCALVRAAARKKNRNLSAFSQKEAGVYYYVYKIIEKERKPAVRWKRRRSRKKGLKFHPFPPQCLPRWTWKPIMCVACRDTPTNHIVRNKKANAPLWHNKGMLRSPDFMLL